MHQQDFVDKLSHESDEPVTKKTVTIRPGQTEVVGLGVYDQSNPEPDFDIICTDEDDDRLSIAFEQFPIDKIKYRLAFALRNDGNSECTVTLSRVAPGVAPMMV